ncbi:hypothetical protein [Janthinobacterium sp. LB2P70]|uniref:hypothetical protein n=1 Tax=Janthinobacterium sp. LB2P70 TaxID=3424197 RepID=UPI003F286A5F
MSKEHPILFNAPMVRALLDGSKTQTRRIVKKVGLAAPAPQSVIDGAATYAGGMVAHCPYGQPGDRIWVRETWGVISHAWDEACNLIDWAPDRPATAISEMPFGQGYYSGHVIYAADGAFEWSGDDDGDGDPRSAWHPSIHMPRRASRILLEIVSVRVERLNDCSEADAIAEGVHKFTDSFMRGLPGWEGYPGAFARPDAYTAYYDLWEKINGAGSWDANPWVWAIEFKRVTP